MTRGLDGLHEVGWAEGALADGPLARLCPGALRELLDDDRAQPLRAGGDGREVREAGDWGEDVDEQDGV